MKVLILYAMAGGGHKRAAQALEAHIRRNTDWDVRLEDSLKLAGRAIDSICCDGYKFSAKHAPAVFGTLYRHANHKSALSGLIPRVFGRAAKKLLPLLREYEPDVVLTTYHFAGQMISALKEAGLTDVPLINIITDYGPHLAWIAPRADAYVVACEDMISELVHMGVSRDRIHPFGIPVFDEFFGRPDRRELRGELGMDPELPGVLIMAGSFGVKNILQVYREVTGLGTPFQVVVITGRNQPLYDAFEQEIPLSRKPTKLVLFTEEVYQYMHACDLIITKPGGLTTSEALASGLPLAVFDAIPGQEEDNANFLLRHNMGIRLKTGQSCAIAIRSLLQDPRRLADMKAACQAFDKSQGSREIVELIQKLTQR